jgi:hypothetical protein
MDMHLVDMNVRERDPERRIAMAGKEVIERYRNYQDVRGTQLIFSDMGTPLKHACKEMAEYEELPTRQMLRFTGTKRCRHRAWI